MPPPKRFNAMANFAVTAEHDSEVRRMADKRLVPVGLIYRELSEIGMRAIRRARRAKRAGRTGKADA